jgi:hypothetical protein
VERVTKFRRVDRSHIDLSDEAQCRYWLRHFKVDRDTLETAISKVGTSASTVRKELRRVGKPQDSGSVTF